LADDLRVAVGVGQRLPLGHGKSEVSRGGVGFKLPDSGRAADDNDRWRRQASRGMVLVVAAVQLAGRAVRG
jgi:hypothetical protein